MQKQLFWSTVAIACALVIGFSVGVRAPFTPIKIEQSQFRSTPENVRVRAAPSKYEYTRDYFTDNIPLWKKMFPPLTGKPLRYLEIGIFEGRSLFWMLENILTHPDSRAEAIDVVLFPKYLQNLERSGFAPKVKNIKGMSQDVMRDMPRESFDIIYIDGAHSAQHVMVDAVLAFDLLKVGGLMVFDDYEWHTEWALEQRPKMAVDAFISAYRQYLTIEHKGYQMIVRKKEPQCRFPTQLHSPIGPYCYRWDTMQLMKSSGELIKIEYGDHKMLSAIAASVRFGETEPDLSALRDLPEFQTLNKRLGLFAVKPKP